MFLLIRIINSKIEIKFCEKTSWFNAGEKGTGQMFLEGKFPKKLLELLQ